MNIIYMHSHDTGRWIEPYGYRVPTPNLQKLSDEGTLFRKAFSACPTCSPSRSALLSGMTPHSNGMIGLSHLGFHLNQPKRHLANYLQEQGYDTVLSGVQHEIAPSHTEELGYGLDLNKVNTGKDATERDVLSAELAADYVRSKGDGKPFFLSLGLFHTHRSGAGFPKAPEFGEVDPNTVMPPYPLGDHAETRSDMAQFIDSAKVMDHCVGLLLRSVEEAGIADETMIIYTTDHGPAFPEMKGQLKDTGIGVSLLVKWPAACGIGEGTTIDSQVSHLDIFPTICELIGSKPPAGLQGCSLLPLATGTGMREKSFIFAETNYHVAYEPSRCIRSERYKLIRLYGPDDRKVLCNIDDSPSKSWWLERGFSGEKAEKVQLYDLALDPYETRNVASDHRYQKIYEELSIHLDEWMKETNDELCHGTIPAPVGAIVKSRANISPSDKTLEQAAGDGNG
ncbi:sulfatase [Paenibacillus sp. HB172176]|uniref:sulfatase family protein n=1 Tax=Paenibacillus sp. HB172176 TaxID=2493690 RepID=UPI00143BCF07|nr:sulfatase [Paenibacillus sp. HB172176]